MPGPERGWPSEIIQAALDYSVYYDSYYGGGMLNIWTDDGNSLPNWPVEFDYVWPTSVAVGDIDGDGDYEVVAACEYDGVVHAYHVESGRLVGASWPIVLGDWGGYIAAVPFWPTWTATATARSSSPWTRSPRAPTACTRSRATAPSSGSGATRRKGRSVSPTSTATAKSEIALSGYGPGLSRVYTFILDSQGQQIARWKGGSQKGTAVGDLNGDGKTEMVFCTEEEVMAVRIDGTHGLEDQDADSAGHRRRPVPWRPRRRRPERSLRELITSRPTDSSTPGSTGLTHKGKPLTGADFPKTMMGNPTRCVPLVADIDGDGDKELIVGLGREPLMAWEADGSVTPGFPMLNLNARHRR